MAAYNKPKIKSSIVIFIDFLFALRIFSKAINNKNHIARCKKQIKLCENSKYAQIQLKSRIREPAWTI